MLPSWALWPIRALIAFLLVAPRNARADEPVPLALRWIAPPECPDAAFLDSYVHRLLDSPEPAPPDTPVQAAATATHTGKRWHVDLVAEAKGSKERRAFVGDTCISVVDATALVLAIMVNPEKVATYQSRVARPVPPPPPPRPAPIPPSPSPSPLAPHAPPPTVFGSVAVFGAVDIGTLPTVGAETGIALGLVVRRLQLDLVGIAEPFHAAPLAAVPDGGVRARLLRGGGRACVSLLDGAFDVSPCIGAELVSMKVRAYGVTKPEEADGAWGEAVVGAGVGWTITYGMGLRADGAAQIPMYRHHLAIPPLGVVHTIPGVTSRVTVGLFVHF